MRAKLCPCKVVFPKTHPEAQGSQRRKAAFGNCSSTHWVDNGERRQGDMLVTGAVPEHREKKDY